MVSSCPQRHPTHRQLPACCLGRSTEKVDASGNLKIPLPIMEFCSVAELSTAPPSSLATTSLLPPEEYEVDEGPLLPLGALGIRNIGESGVSKWGLSTRGALGGWTRGPPAIETMSCFVLRSLVW